MTNVQTNGPLERLVGAARAAVGPPGRAGSSRLPHRDGWAALLREALQSPDLLPAGITDVPPPTGFGKYLLHAEPSLVMYASVTMPGCLLPIHDHGSWGVAGVYDGVEEEISFEAADPADPRLVEVGRETYERGDVMSFEGPPLDIHQVMNRGSTRSITIHLHGDDIVARGFNVYLPPDHRPHHTGPLTYDPIPEPPS